MFPALMGSASMFGGAPLSAVVRGPLGEDHRAERIDVEKDLRAAEGHICASTIAGSRTGSALQSPECHVLKLYERSERADAVDLPQH